MIPGSRMSFFKLIEIECGLKDEQIKAMINFVHHRLNAIIG